MPGDLHSPGGADGVRVVLGVGASRGCPPDELRELADACLAEAGVPRAAVAAVASADVKADEPAVLVLAADLGVPARFLAADVLAVVAVPTPSATVARHVGTPSVAEASALLVAAALGEETTPDTALGGSTAPHARPDGATATEAGTAGDHPAPTAASLLVPKRRSARATCAVARAVPAGDPLAAAAADDPRDAPAPTPAEVPAP